MIRLASVACLATSLFALPAGAQAPLTCADVRELVIPSLDDLRAETIPWRTTFAAGALEADQTDKPILLWAMNGHPLGCT